MTKHKGGAPKGNTNAAKPTNEKHIKRAVSLPPWAVAYIESTKGGSFSGKLRALIEQTYNRT